MSADHPRLVYVNLAVRDLDRSVEFFSKLGFAFDPRFTDDSATAMIINDQAGAMLIVEDRFEEFTKKAITDARTHTEVLVALTAESREEVDALVDTALEAGAQPASDPMEPGFMYSRSFQDLDGHIWEFFWMDPSALEE